MEWITLLAAGLTVLTVASTTPDTKIISFGEVAYGGSGCSAGEAQIKSLGTLTRIRTDDFVVKTGVDDPAVDRKSCNLSIPVQVPSGYQIALPTIQVRGKVDLNDHSNARLDTEIFFAGQAGVKQSETFQGGLQKRFKLNFSTNNNAWSACGASVNIRVNLGLLVRSARGQADQGMITSIRLPTNLQVRACH
ncbi:MAG: DUF4360 domain-containing protein [Thiofilum sp.]|uniref:DUF4360 domain-containing protein n=1 Tax=Thiofilum sp. TaxID=2212733 RepID=UPI0025F5884D|nr:DUF4360 domain-containing protein [Thiofilum sp.]MBK8451819.1 DUF4360 domain-containing protein [Thiofilum sp.]